MRGVLRALSALLTAFIAAWIAAAWFAASPAAAAVPRADLGVSAAPASGQVGELVEVHYAVRNNGPNPVTANSWAVDIVAPAGTRFGAGNTLGCVPVAGRVRCHFAFGLKKGEKRDLMLNLRIESAPSGCGRIFVVYGNDPRPGNNAANLRVTVGGKPSSCGTADHSPSPSPKASKSTSPRTSASPSPDPEVAEPLPEDSGSVLAAPVPDSASAEPGSGPSLASILVIGGGALLVVLGGVLIWRLLRKDPEDYYDDDDATGPIYG